eukprot:CAMPEP_0172184762 /NCGR_PEP_ID=MMETSP1050-20130122/19767_1 /TAXON_ID=233186 /ORGANISM="Cryptomonas curvata, Strain CCAP979/52" /LENGTH=77 /DNA_ID=CAMNT_0012858619 /DNA_START=9 /DNA_END=242 /DNA_ORIENTATION=+
MTTASNGFQSLVRSASRLNVYMLERITPKLSSPTTSARAHDGHKTPSTGLFAPAPARLTDAGGEQPASMLKGNPNNI